MLAGRKWEKLSRLSYCNVSGMGSMKPTDQTKGKIKGESNNERDFRKDFRK